jgi:hypothetical protein
MERKLPIKKLSLTNILQLIALIITISIFFKAIIDFDNNYDSGWYQLPFAARIWGIVPKELFMADDSIEYRFKGFPLLANFLQGFLWKITGRIQATNLVSFLSLIAYFFFLRNYFQIPLYIGAIALFAVPAVLTHASTSFVDLPGNIGVSILVMMTYSFFKEHKLPTRKALFVAFLGATVAVNTKSLLQPLVFLIVCIVGIRLIWLYFKQSQISRQQLIKIVPVAILASILIFATPVKNIALYGNPFYPIKVEVAGIVLNHKLDPQAYNKGNRPQKWLHSILEIRTPNWSPHQWNGNDFRYMDRGGGFFGAYVIFNILLLLSFFLREQLRNRQVLKIERVYGATIALVTVILMSIVPANFPQSHELRYFMFWMISLISLNLCLISQPQTNAQKWRWLQSKYMGLVYLIFLTIVLNKIGNLYAKPVFYSLDQHLSLAVKPELFSQIKPNEKICLISRHAIINPKEVPFASIQNAFFYSSYFHPELDYSYSIKVQVNPKKLEKCGDRKVVPNHW